MIAALDETVEEFNDMSYMQAIDIITAIEVVKVLLKENDLEFNTGRVIGYGHSHGAYLLHLSNRLAPNLFSFIIDNSAWIEPLYLTHNRIIYQSIGHSTLVTEFNYLAKKIIRNKHDLNLYNLYEDFQGNAQILTFQGDQDHLVNHMEKKRVIESLNDYDFILVTAEDIDDKKYKSNQHGLSADYLELFLYALDFERPRRGDTSSFSYDYEISFDGVDIKVDSPHGLPFFYFNFK